MTTTTDVFTGRHAVLGRTERAQEAIKVFRTMQPQLSGFARAITGRREVKVVLDTGTPRTDGKSIYYRPPITLGDKIKHDRSLCEKRGADKVLLCMACAQREAVLAVIYHEIAHIAFDSFDPPTEEQRKEIITRAVSRAEGKRAEGIAARIQASPYWQKDSYLGLASLVSEYLPFIVNCLEDARVNREMFKARPGTRIMFETDAYRALMEGVEQGNGQVMQWRDYSLNAQISVGLLCKAAGYEFGGNLLHPAVGRAMADKKLTALINRMDSVRSVSGVYELSLPVLQRLQDLGFCIDHPEDEPEPEPQPEEESEDKSDETEPDTEAAGDPAGDPGKSERKDEAESDDSGSGLSDSEDSEVDDGDGVPSESDKSGAGKPDTSTEDEENVDGEGQPGEESGQGGGSDEGEPDAESDDEADTGTDGEGGTGDPAKASDGLDESDPGQSGGAGSVGEDEERDASDAGGSDAGAESDDEAESGDQSGEVGTGNIGGEPEAGDAGGEAGSGDGDRGEAESGDGDAPPDGESTGSGGSDEGADDGSQPGADSTADDAPSGDGATEARPEGAEGDAESGDSRGAEPGSDTDMAPEHAGDGSDKAASRSSVGDPSDDTLPAEEAVSGDGDPRGDAVEEPEEPSTGDHDELDTGADAGTGGVETDAPLPATGEASDAKKALKIFGGHEDAPPTLEEVKDDEALNVAIIQGLYFETPSTEITGVRVHKFGHHEFGEEPEGWSHDFIKRYYEYSLEEIGVVGDTEISESVLGPCLTRMRVAFSDNKRNRMNPNLKSGRIRKQALGKRAWGDDERLFQKKTIAKKRDYLVVIGIDISGSTTGVNLILAKRAAMAQAELCHRLGVKFAVYAHTAQRPTITAFEGSLSLEMYEIKGPDEPWSAKAREAFAQIGPVAENLDGHSIEFYRKICDASTATDNIILYYTDGKMPAANHDEELEILQREIKYCKQKGYHLLGVGIRTDSPKRHGLDTVQVDNDEDLVNVVRHLEKRLI